MSPDKVGGQFGGARLSRHIHLRLAQRGHVASCGGEMSEKFPKRGRGASEGV